MTRFLSYGFALLTVQTVLLSALQAAPVVPDGMASKTNFADFWKPDPSVKKKTGRFLIPVPDRPKTTAHNPDITAPPILEQKKSHPELSEWDMKFNTARLMAASA